MKSFIYSACACAALALLVGCGGGGSGGTSNAGGGGVIDPAPQPVTVQASDCFNADWLAAGTTYSLTYEYSGEKTGKRSFAGSVIGNALFGEVVGTFTKIVEKMTSQLTEEDLDEPQTVTKYVSVDGKNVTEVGRVEDTLLANDDSIQRVRTWGPSIIYRQYGLMKDVGYSFTSLQSILMTTLTASELGPVTDQSSDTLKVDGSVSYVGPESMTLGGRSFTACKFKTVVKEFQGLQEVKNQTTYDWIDKGTGARLKFRVEQTGNADQYHEAVLTSGTLNGKAL